MAALAAILVAFAQNEDVRRRMIGVTGEMTTPPWHGNSEALWVARLQSGKIPFGVEPVFPFLVENAQQAFTHQVATR